MDISKTDDNINRKEFPSIVIQTTTELCACIHTFEVMFRTIFQGTFSETFLKHARDIGSFTCHAELMSFTIPCHKNGIES